MPSAASTSKEDEDQGLRSCVLCVRETPQPGAPQKGVLCGARVLTNRAWLLQAPFSLGPACLTRGRGYPWGCRVAMGPGLLRIFKKKNNVGSTLGSGVDWGCRGRPCRAPFLTIFCRACRLATLCLARVVVTGLSAAPPWAAGQACFGG